MLASFFSKSGPVNFLLVGIYMILFFFMARVNQITEFSFSVVLKEILVLLLFLLSMVTLDFIAKKNVLTERNAYKTLLFAAFTCMFFEILRNSDVIIANFFILLALRRIVSLKSQHDSIRKIFDAALWICVASIFYFWSILFLALVFVGIFIHLRQYFKLYMVPMIAFLAVLSIANSFDLLFNDSFYIAADWIQSSEFDFTKYGVPTILVPVSLLGALTLWTLFFYLNLIQKTTGNTKASLMLIFLALVIALTVAFFAPTKNSSELLFFLGPLVIIVTNYMQGLKDKWFKEILLILIAVVPFILLFLF